MDPSLYYTIFIVAIMVIKLSITGTSIAYKFTKNESFNLTSDILETVFITSMSLVLIYWFNIFNLFGTQNKTKNGVAIEFDNMTIRLMFLYGVMIIMQQITSFIFPEKLNK